MKRIAIAIGLAALCAGCGEYSAAYRQEMAEMNAKFDAEKAATETARRNTLPPRVFIAMGGDPSPSGDDRWRNLPTLSCSSTVFHKHARLQGKDFWTSGDMERDDDYPVFTTKITPYAVLWFPERKEDILLAVHVGLPDTFTKTDLTAIRNTLTGFGIVPAEQSNGCFRMITPDGKLLGGAGNLRKEKIVFDYCPKDHSKSSGAFYALDDDYFKTSDTYYAEDILIKFTDCVAWSG